MISHGKLMSKYYQLPQSDGPYDSDVDRYTSRGFSFSMRMLNFLSKLKVRDHWKHENQYTVFNYARRLTLAKFRRGEILWQKLR